MKNAALLLTAVFALILLGFISARDKMETSLSSQPFAGDLFSSVPAPGKPGPISGESNSSKSCTIIYASDGHVALAGNNEDFKGRLARIHFLPAEKGKLDLGCIFLPDGD